MVRLLLVTIASVLSFVSAANAGTKVHLHVELYKDIYSPALVVSQETTIGLLSNGTALQLKNASGEIEEAPVKGRYEFYLQKAEGNYAKVKFNLYDYSSMTRGGGGYSRQLSVPVGLLTGETDEITFSLGDLGAGPGEPEAGFDYLLKLRVERIEACDDQSTCYEP